MCLCQHAMANPFGRRCRTWTVPSGPHGGVLPYLCPGGLHHCSGSEHLYDPIMQPLFEVTVTQMCTSNSRQKHKYLVMIIKQQLDAN
jgi:hypothetical protein